MERRFLIFLCFLNFSFASLVEKQIEKMMNNLNESEIKLAKSLQLCDSYLKFAVLNLKASDVPENITKPMETMRNSFQEMSRIKNFNSFEFLSNLSECDHLTSRSSLIEFELWSQDKIYQSLTQNLTKLYEIRAEILEIYQEYVKILRKFLSKELFLARTWRHFAVTGREFLKHLQLLEECKRFMNKLLEYLKAEEINLSCPVVNKSFEARGNLIERNLEPFEDQLASE